MGRINSSLAGARYWAAGISLLMAQGATAQFVEGRYESTPEFSAQEVVPDYLYKSAHYQLQDEVSLRENTFGFEVDSEFGPFRVFSLPLLRVRLGEVTVLAQAVNQFKRRSEPLGAELRGVLSVRGDSFGEILTSPLRTAGSLANQLQRNVRETLGDDVGGRPRQGARTAPAFRPNEDPVFAAHRRTVASQLKLDVYSRNPQVQQFLDAVARARENGSASAGFTLVSGKRHDGVRVGGGRIDAQVESVVRQLAALDLDIAVFDELVTMGVGSRTAGAFRNNLALSPRHRLTIAAHLDFLGGVKGRELLVELASRASSESEALGVQEMVRMLASYHERAVPVRRIVLASGRPAALNAREELVVALPVDVIYWNTLAADLAGALEEAMRKYRGRTAHVLLTGTMTARAESAFRRRGMEVLPAYLDEN